MPKESEQTTAIHIEDPSKLEVTLTMMEMAEDAVHFYGEDLESFRSEIRELLEAAKFMKEGMRFYDKVLNSSEAEKIAVGTDHYKWIMKAARRISQLV